MTKLCKDCKYHKLGTNRYQPSHICLAFSEISPDRICLVTGEHITGHIKTFVSCFNARDTEEQCGKEGKSWKMKGYLGE